MHCSSQAQPLWTTHTELQSKLLYWFSNDDQLGVQLILAHFGKLSTVKMTEPVPHEFVYGMIFHEAVCKDVIPEFMRVGTNMTPLATSWCTGEHLTGHTATLLRRT